MEKNETVRLNITDMSTNGEGIGHAGGYALFVKDTVIGDEIEAKVIAAKKDYGYGKLLKILVPSQDRTEAPCPLARRCGGCTLQEMNYEKQLALKTDLVRNALKRIGGFDLPVRQAQGMEEPYRYRNKSQFPVGTDRNGKIIAGFYAGRTHDIMDVRDCLLGKEENADILAAVISHMEKYGIPAYDEKTGQGLIRHVLIREGFATGEIMVCLIISGTALPHAEELVQTLLKIRGMKSICLNVNTKRNNVILGETVLPLSGEPFITDRIGDLQFRISPLSFYQINPVQTKKLYDTVREFADLHGTEQVFDLYCGIGTIGLYLASGAGRVIGVESVPDAVRDAKINARLNGIGNAEFITGAAEEKIDVLPEADVVVVDPPRRGCEEKLLASILSRKPKKIIYVSCNPSTLARDLKILCAEKYRVSEVRPFDMFPQTCHVETVVLMSRQNA